jgi:hypothetical protein
MIKLKRNFLKVEYDKFQLKKPEYKGKFAEMLVLAEFSFFLFFVFSNQT